MLRNVAEIDLSTSVLGQRVSMPICVGATAMQCMAHVDGELATVRGRNKVLTQRDRNGLTFSDTLLCMHQANTSLDVFILTKVKLIDWHQNACSCMSCSSTFSLYDSSKILSFISCKIEIKIVPTSLGYCED